ncbi:hypothetical protein KY308_00905 [Candidatus Woesearchaeota archaeon]|nr:hypothetical protein [Candidatus Woesearchaeota archaeon]
MEDIVHYGLAAIVAGAIVGRIINKSRYIDQKIGELRKRLDENFTPEETIFGGVVVCENYGFLARFYGKKLLKQLAGMNPISPERQSEVRRYVLDYMAANKL